MTQEERQLLLLVDLCSRLPYGVKVLIPECRQDAATLIGTDDKCFAVKYGKSTFYCPFHITIKPYLRPLSSMTEEERKEYEGFIIHREHVNAWGQEWDIDCFSFDNSPRLIDWLNAHHFDYRDLISKGLALEAPEDMYKEEQE